MLKNNDEYLSLVSLIRKTTKIESMLNILEGSGKSIWEKSKSIRQVDTEDFMSRIIKILVIRSSALRGDLDELKIVEAIKESNIVLHILYIHERLNYLKTEIEVKLEKAKMFSKDSNIKLTQNIMEVDSNNIEYLAIRLENEELRLQELDRYIKNYWIEKRLKPLGLGIFIIIVASYIWTKYTV